MRLLFLTMLTVSAVIRYGSCSPNKKLSSQSMLGRALLRRALAAMSNSPRIHVNRRSLDEEEPSGDDIKQTDAMEDIFVGSGSRSDERGESSGTRRSDINQDQSSGSDEQSNDIENSAESSGDDGTAQTGEQTPGQETRGDTVDASGQEEADKTEDQQEDSGASSGDDTVEAASETQTTPLPGSVSSETSPVDDEGSGSEPNQETETNSDKTTPAETTLQVAKSDNQTQQESKNANEKEVKKSTIAKVLPSIVTVKEDADTSATSSGESDEVTSDTETTSGELSGVEEDGSAEAIRKGMESLSKLLKPVASGLDFQLFSGASKPEDEEEEEDKEEEEQSTVSKAEGKGESEKADEVEEKKPKVVKVKKCETKCALPMTYDQCAVPRCEYKMGTIKDLCIYLCKHQKPVCKQECKEVE